METEIKFFYTSSERHPQLLNHPLIQNHVDTSGFMQYAMRSVYYDTANQYLRSLQSVLRIRSSNQRVYLTVKLPVQEDGGFFKREEWEIELLAQDLPIRLSDGLNVDRLIGRLNETGQAVNESLQTWLRQIADKPLFEVCGANFTRTAYAFQYRTSHFELSFDEGYLFAGDAIDAFEEVELELLSGDEEDLRALYRKWLRGLPLKPANRSKYERAISLADQFR